MPLVVAYHRPESIPDALMLLTDPTRVVLAGGTTLNADREPSRLEAVDLQALGLRSIEADGDRVRCGAMATLDDMFRSDLLPAQLRAVAQAEQPSTLRTLATVGGTIAGAEADSLLLAALMAHDGHVELAGADDRSVADLVVGGVPGGSLITAVTLDPSGPTAEAHTGRTPADVPIVGAYGRRGAGFVSVALTGVADHPVFVDVSNPTAGLNPDGDFRGSTEYRLELARILTERVMEGLG